VLTCEETKDIIEATMFLSCAEKQQIYDASQVAKEQTRDTALAYSTQYISSCLFFWFIMHILIFIFCNKNWPLLGVCYIERASRKNKPKIKNMDFFSLLSKKEKSRLLCGGLKNVQETYQEIQKSSNRRRL